MYYELKREVLNNYIREMMFEYKIYCYKSWFSALRTNFTQGGVCAFKAESMPDPLTESEKTLINCREGYYGWMGFGGSIFEVKQLKETLLLI